MTEVMVPEALNERFTIRPGLPPKRLREMRGEEVLEAMEFHHDEVERLQREAESYAEIIAVATKPDVADTLSAGQLEQMDDALLKMEGVAEASDKTSRLICLVLANLPPAAQNMTLSESLPRFWPTRGVA